MLLFLYISFKTKLEEYILIREANLNDVDAIMDIIKQIIVEMKESKNTQWDETYPKAENVKQDIEEESQTLSTRPVTAGWFTLDGRKLQSAPTRSGIYIHNGRKVSVK